MLIGWFWLNWVYSMPGNGIITPPVCWMTSSSSIAHVVTTHKPILLSSTISLMTTVIIDSARFISPSIIVFVSIPLPISLTALSPH